MRVMLLRFTILSGTKNSLTWRNTPLVNFNMNEGEEIPYPQDMIDEAIKYLLDREVISMTWDDEIEEMVFFMTEEQKHKPLPDDWHTSP